MDGDSTLVSGEVIDMLAARAGSPEQDAKVTAGTVRGEVECSASVAERIELVAGMDVTILDQVRRDLRLAPGARTLIRTLRRLGYRCGIVSGGFTHITDWLFFFKQKTAYEVGLGIPAEPLFRS